MEKVHATVIDGAVYDAIAAFVLQDDHEEMLHLKIYPKAVSTALRSINISQAEMCMGGYRGLKT